MLINPMDIETIVEEEIKLFDITNVEVICKKILEEQQEQEEYKQVDVYMLKVEIMLNGEICEKYITYLPNTNSATELINDYDIINDFIDHDISYLQHPSYLHDQFIIFNDNWLFIDNIYKHYTSNSVQNIRNAIYEYHSY